MNAKRIGLVLAILLYIIFFTPIFSDQGDTVRAFAMLGIIQILWVGRIFPLAYTTLLLFLLVSFYLLPFDEVMGYLGSANVWLLFATFIISGAFIESGLAKRIAFYMLRFSGGESKALLFMSFVVMTVLSFLIPTNIGRVALFGSLFHTIVEHLKKTGSVKNLGKALFIGMNYVVALSGAMVITGSNTSIYAFELFQTTSNIEWSFLLWILLFAPPILLSVFLLWCLILWIFPLEKLNRDLVKAYIDEEIGQLGRLNISEIKMILIIIVTVTLWILQFYHGLSVPMVGILGAVLTMAPYIGIWKWEKAKKQINWDLLLFFAGSLVLSHVLINSGALDWLSNVLVNDTFLFNNLFISIITVGVLTVALRIIFVNALGFMTIMIPLSLLISQQLTFMPPMMLAMIVLLVGMPGFFLITQSPINILSIQFNHFSEKDLLKSGVYVSALVFLIVMGTTWGYWWFFLT